MRPYWDLRKPLRHIVPVRSIQAHTLTCDTPRKDGLGIVGISISVSVLVTNSKVNHKRLHVIVVEISMHAP